MTATLCSLSTQPSIILTFLLLFHVHACRLQLLFAVSPLLVLAYILISAFESEEQEERKRKKKSDFNLEGHSE
jgi:hypothetical protein